MTYSITVRGRGANNSICELDQMFVKSIKCHGYFKHEALSLLNENKFLLLEGVSFAVLSPVFQAQNARGT